MRYEDSHATVLGPEAVEWLKRPRMQTMVDATAGHGGHACLLADCMPNDGELVLVDAQADALAIATERASRPGLRITAIQGNFRHLPELLGQHGIGEVDGVLFDQGLSSADIEGDLGFSFRRDAPLDMRRSRDVGETAAEVLARLDAHELARVLWEYGEERWAARIARRIVDFRRSEPIERTSQLVRLIEQSVPRRAWPRGIHVATRSMMALRYYVNDDINAIKEAIAGIVPMLSLGGRCVCISFCSLEDRAVKHTMRSLENPCTCPPDLPQCVCGRRPMLKVLTKRGVRPTAEEVAANRRSRSAVMRVGERI